MTKPEDEPPWGTYAPDRFSARLIALSRAMAQNRGGRIAAGLIRRMVMARLDTPLDLTFMDAPVRFYPHDNLAEKRVAFMPQFFDPEELAALAAILRPGFVFIDLGANAGFYSLWVASQAGKNATIIAVEPQPEMARRLRFNCHAGQFANIIHEDAAISDGPGKAVLNIVHENRGASSFSRRGKTISDETVTVNTMALLALMDKYGIHRADAIKIDIEGAEDRVLPVFFETCPPDRLPLLLIVERNDQWQVDCLALAKNAGYYEADIGRNNAILTLKT